MRVFDHYAVTATCTRSSCEMSSSMRVERRGLRDYERSLQEQRTRAQRVQHTPSRLLWAAKHHQVSALDQRLRQGRLRRRQTRRECPYVRNLIQIWFGPRALRYSSRHTLKTNFYRVPGR